MYLLDTNICIYGMKGKFPSLTNKLLTVNPDEICVSSVTLGELEYGAAKSKWGDRTRENMLLFMSSFTVIPFSARDSLFFGGLRAILDKEGRPIGPYDIMIAAQGVANDYTVVTHNTKEFERVPNIKLEDWCL